MAICSVAELGEPAMVLRGHEGAGQGRPEHRRQGRATVVFVGSMG